MTQTWAIFYDAYRSLNAKKMFWIVLILSGLIVAAFAAVGINKDGLTILGRQWDNPAFNTGEFPGAMFYKVFLFSFLGVHIWLGMVATILGLVSTAGIFPDLINSGAIDLVIAKPISRLRLFLTQYVAGLLFVALQVTAFCLGGFFLIGLRGGEWEPGIFVAVPLVVCLFSYFFAVSVFLGLITRSTIASLLLTLLVWIAVFSIGKTEQILLFSRTMEEMEISMVDLQNEQAQAKRRGGANPDREKPSEEQPSPPVTKKKPERTNLAIAHDIFYYAKLALPKMSETVSLLEQTVISMAELEDQQSQRGETEKRANKGLEEAFGGRSVAWVLGTSLGFELFFLAWAAWIFCRRDF